MAREMGNVVPLGAHPHNKPRGRDTGYSLAFKAHCCCCCFASWAGSAMAAANLRKSAVYTATMVGLRGAHGGTMRGYVHRGRGYTTKIVPYVNFAIESPRLAISETI